MSSSDQAHKLDRYAEISELALRVRRLLKRFMIPLLLVLGAATGMLIFTGNPGGICFGFISLGTLVVLFLWQSNGIGLPIIPLIAVQHLIVYGLPILVRNEAITDYPPSLLFDAGFEVLVFSCCLAMSWRMAMQVFRPGKAVSYALPDFQKDGSNKLRRLGFSLITVGTLYQVLEQLDLLQPIFDLLPSGSVSLMVPLVTGANACGFFLISLFVGARDLNNTGRALFWALLTLSCAISASGFLLSAATTMIGAVMIGLFWSTGKIPWRYLTVVMLLLAFFSISKFTMRGRYWSFDEGVRPVSTTLLDMPRIYLEWTEASIEAITTSDSANAPRSARPDDNHQSLLQRVNNLQNLLFAINAIQISGISPLGGGSYAIIPPLFVPRIMWPDKPRTHEGQVMLNVHFGRQDLDSTFRTYVAWGLLPEAYGNYGAFWGSFLLGCVLGISLAWLENYTTHKLLLSLEGFVCFTVLLCMVNSFEMVASVLLTMIYQAVIPIIFASMPFLRRMSTVRPID
ncbi:MAG: hypothetical protein JSS11_03100 [Verrucomicrobia bacterium]|nr:hypothetical protein [Verrucomicrobiota bacterium]